MFAGPIQELVDELGRLPGVGPRSAQRIAFYVLEADRDLSLIHIYRESGQGRKAAALSGFACVPQGTWLLRTTAPELWGVSRPVWPAG